MDITGEFPKDKLKVNIDNHVLSVSGENMDERKDDESYSKSYTSFSRSVRLPPEVDEDNVRAKHENGCLKLELPKLKNPRQSRRNIDIA